MSKKIFEFLVWDNCNNHCRFCFLKDHNPCKSILDNNGKAESLHQVLNYLKSPSFEEGSHVLLCGGELFDTVFDSGTAVAFHELITHILGGIVQGTIESLYVNTNLIYDPSIMLNRFLSYFDNAGFLNKLHFTTSFDLIGRYKTPEDKQQFIRNVRHLHSRYPALEIIANMVMTKQVCRLICDGDVSIRNLQDDLDVSINLIPYIILHDNMAPTKELVLDTLKAVNAELPGYIKTHTDRFILDTPRVLLKYHNKKLEEMTTPNSTCGHSVNFKRYTKEGSCFICDLQKLAEEYK